MTLLDLQILETPETTGGGGGSNVSLLLCDKHSSHSNILCL
ncbi:SapB/AmfS family lanthipeptide [Streptomyces boninensis]